MSEQVMAENGKDEQSLADFMGENWNQTVIPVGMEKYAAESRGHHHDGLRVEAQPHAKKDMAHSGRATRAILLQALVLSVSWLAGCAHEAQTLIPVDNAPLDAPSQVARLNGRTKHPMLLRGLDQLPLETPRIRDAFIDHDYVVKAGKHTLWVMNSPYGHPLVPQRIHCYVIDVELTGGTRYRLEEDWSQKLARVLRADTGQQVASGQLVDEAWIFARECRWQ